MLFSEKMNAAINEQIGREFAASLEYVSIASRFASEGLTELAKHFYRQAEEERDHAMRFVKYVVDARRSDPLPRPEGLRSQLRALRDRLRRRGSPAPPGGDPAHPHRQRVRIRH
jgi:ferritin